MSTVTTYELAVHLSGRRLSRAGRAVVSRHGLKHKCEKDARVAAHAIKEEAGAEVLCVNLSKVRCTHIVRIYG